METEKLENETPVTEKRKKSKIVRWFVRIFITLVVFAVIVFLSLYIPFQFLIKPELPVSGKVGSPISAGMGDMLPIPSEVFEKWGIKFEIVPPEENAALYYDRANELFVIIDDFFDFPPAKEREYSFNSYKNKDYIYDERSDRLLHIAWYLMDHGWTDEAEELIPWFEANNLMIQKFCEAASKPGFQIIYHYDIGTTLIAGRISQDSLDNIIGIRYFMPVYSTYLIHEGRFHEAVDVQLDCIRCGLHFMHGLTNNEFLVGLFIQQSTTDTLMKLFLDAHTPTEVLTYARDQLASLTKQIPSVKKIISNERALSFAQLTDIYRGYITIIKAPKGSEKFDTFKINYSPGNWWQRSLRFWANLSYPISKARKDLSTYYDKIETFAKLPSHEVIARMDELIDATKKIMHQNDVLHFSISNIITVFPRRAQIDTNLNITLVMAALELYKRDTGAYPDNINALVPDYLDAVPIDAASGKPLLYRKEKDYCVVWSVGADGVDNGGDTTKRNSFSYIGGDTDYYFTNKKPEPEPFTWPPKYFYDN